MLAIFSFIFANVTSMTPPDIYETGETVYSFGDGLSYSEFNHQLVQAPKEVSAFLEEGHVCRSSECKSIEAAGQTCETLGFDVHLRVKNMGRKSGSHTVFFFSSPPSVHNSPGKHLVSFEKVNLNPETETMVKFKVDVCKDLSMVDEVGRRKVAFGKHVLHIGSLKHSLTVRI